MSEAVARRFEAPRRIDDALALLAEHGAAARVLAGGTDLLAQLKSGARHPAVIVDLKRIDELMQVRETGGALVIGAAAPAAELREHATLRRWFPGLAEAAALIGSEQIQGRASLGGNLCNASPAADTTPALLVNEATLEIAGAGGQPQHRRRRAVHRAGAGRRCARASCWSSLRLRGAATARRRGRLPAPDSRAPRWTSPVAGCRRVRMTLAPDGRVRRRARRARAPWRRRRSACPSGRSGRSPARRPRRRSATRSRDGRPDRARRGAPDRPTCAATAVYSPPGAAACSHDRARGARRRTGRGAEAERMA